MRKESEQQPPQEPPRQGQPMQLGMQVVPGGAVLSFPVNLAMDDETTMQFVKLFLNAHPELVQEIVKEAIAQKQQELAIIQMVKRSRNEIGRASCRERV